MGLSITLTLIVLTASSAIECAKTLKPSEICACVPLNICAEINKFSKEDAKYFNTVLKCKEEGFIRCCPNHKKSTLRRSDDDENVVLIDKMPSENLKQISLTKFEDSSKSIDVEMTTKQFELTTIDSEMKSLDDDDAITTDTSDELFTTVSSKPEENAEVAFENSRKSKFIDNNVEVIYANQESNDELNKKKKVMEHLFLIFPNGEIQAALATLSTVPPQFIKDEENFPIKPKRVIVRKRLIKKSSLSSLEGAESKISQAVIEPKQMDVEEVKKRLSGMLRNNRGRVNYSSTTESPSTTTAMITTENPVEEAKVKKPRRKIKLRMQKQTSTAAPITTSKTLLDRGEKAETSTMKSRRKIIYDARGRTNFLKRPSTQQSDFDNDEPIEPEVITTTTTPATAEKPAELAANNFMIESFITTQAPHQVVKHFNQIDFEHQAMIETVHKTLSAIHSGVDIKFVEKMIESHKSRMKEIRQNPSSTFAVVDPTRPYRGSATFHKPATAQPYKDDPETQVGGTRTRNLSRTRNTATTHLTTHKSTRKAPRTFVTQPQSNPIMNKNSLLEEVDMPPKMKKPADFRASPLYGITMDKFNEFDGDMIEKLHDTLQSPSDTHSGFFPVIQNGTPSTLL